MEYSSYIRAILALAFVAGLIGITSYLLKRFFYSNQLIKRKSTTNNLSTEEILPIDAKRRLIRIKNGDKEHLLLLGINSDLLIESKAAKKKENT